MKKTAYVTGADRGLGYSLAQALLEKGYKVYAGQFMPEWGQLGKLQEKYGTQLVIFPLDVSDLSQVRDAAAQIAKNENTLDVLCNVAGIHSTEEKDGVFKGDGSIFDRFDERDYEWIHKMYDVNTLGPLRVTNSVIELIKNSKGKTIINISSEAGSIGDNWRDDMYGYCMSKAALNMQSAILQHSVKEHGIKVLSIHPGYLRSYMRGDLNTKATVEPTDAANAIADMLQNPQYMDIDSPMYIDYNGKPLPY